MQGRAQKSIVPWRILLRYLLIRFYLFMLGLTQKCSKSRVGALIYPTNTGDGYWARWFNLR